MSKDCQNIYQAARIYAHMSCEMAAMQLSISTSTVRKYEAGTLTVPNDTALEMSKIYRTPWLRVQHLQSNSVFCDLFGLMPRENGSKAINVLSLQKEVGEVVACIPEIIKETLANAALNSRLVRECKEACTALLMIIGAEKGQDRLRGNANGL